MNQSAATSASVCPHPLRQFTPCQGRRILLLFPGFSYSFGTFNHAFPLMNVKAFMPPQGILLVAALLPKGWETRFVDENVRAATAEDFEWADVVFTTGMHIQRTQINDIVRRAHQAGKPVALGGPSVSSAPQDYPEADFLHLGEAGDATLRLFEWIDQSAARPGQQMVYRTVDKLPLDQFPVPAYRHIRVLDYLLGCIQFSSGCPFTCEFCDIPVLYGRNPRLKRPEQVLRELDELADGGAVSIYFVDDNFIGNPKAARALLPHLVEWQKRRDYSVRLSCEATLNIASHPDILELMRQAFFTNMFIGIETPEPGALRAMRKTQNLRSPMLDAVRTINRHGIEVASGIIVGFDTDTPETPQAIIEFARAAQVPILTPNILYALPNTALYRRLEADGRILSEAESAHRDSNIRFLRPYEEVVGRWLEVIGEIYRPEALYARYDYNATHTYPYRMLPTQPWRQLTARNLRRGLSILARVIWNVGLRSDYRRVFWQMGAKQMLQGHFETFFQVAMVGHHLITYARECLAGKLQASNYSKRVSGQTEPPAGDRRVADANGHEPMDAVSLRASYPIDRWSADGKQG
jgi:hopanoid C-2 methylase